MSNAVDSIGAVFQKWTASAWVDIAEVKTIAGPGMSRETIDVTTLSSTGGYREFIGSFRDSGTVALGMHFTRSGYALMLTDYESDDLQNYQIVLPDSEATAIEFEGLVTEMPLKVGVGEAVTLDITIKISDAIAVSSGGSAAPA